MPDRFDLLNNFIVSIAGDLPGLEEDDDFDIPLYTPPAPAKKIIPPPNMAAVPPIKVEPIMPEKPIEQIPIPTPAPVAPAPSVTQPPAQVQQSPQKRELPSWFPQDWKPIRKIKIDDEFPTSHWGKFDDEVEKPEVAKEPEAAAIEEKPKDIRFEPEPEPNMSTEEAKTYLESLPENQYLSEAIVALNYADEELNTNYGNKKLISTVLALVIAHLKGLIDHAEDVFSENKDKAISAVQILIDDTEEQIKKLPKRFQERTEKELYKAIEGRKRGPLRELKSEWYGPELIFINNRSIRLMKSAGMSIDDAEKNAQDEWLFLNNLVEKSASELKPKEKEELVKLGAQKLLAGGSVEDTETLITQHIEAINSGIISADSISTEDDRLTKLFPDVRVDPDADWENEYAEDMSNEEFVLGNLDGLPPTIASSLSTSISQFGKQALKFAALKDAIERGIDEDKMVEVDDNLQIIYDNIESLARQIFVINPKYIEEPLVHELFEDVYIVFKSVRAEAKDQGLESISDRTISPAESASEGLSIDPAAPGIKETDPMFKRNPRLQRQNESDADYKERQDHEKELADASRHRYLQRLLVNGDPLGYLERKRQYRLAQRPKESHNQYMERIRKEDEMDRIRKPEYKKNKQELVKWRYLASKNPKDITDADLRSQIKSLLKSQESRTYDLLKRINDSWLPKDILKEIENSLIDRRISNFQHELDTIKNLTGMNPLVLKSLEFMITQIPRYFDEARTKTIGEKFSSSNIIYDMVSKFDKYIIAKY